MRRSTLGWVGLVLFGLAARAEAQGATPPPPQQPSSVGAPAATSSAATAAPSDSLAPEPPPAAAAPSAVPPPPPPPPPSAAVQAACLLGMHGMIPTSDAMTAAALVCEALRDAGGNVDDHPVPAGGATSTAPAYRIDLRPLGRIVILSVAFEAPRGSTQDTRSLRLASIEEVPIAAPRLADSLLTGKPLSETARVDTLVGQETRAYDKEYGELKLGVGVLGFAVPASDVLGGYGVHGQLYYETARYAVGAELRIGGSDASSGDASLAGISLGARYFFGDADITPFVGGGMGILWLDFATKHAPVTTPTYYDSSYARFEGTGLAAHADFGVEFLRLHDARFDVLLRVDAPLFQLHDGAGSGSHDRYALPISLMGSYSFQ